MKYRVADVTAEARVVMDMNRSDAPLLGVSDSDALDTGEVVRGVLEPAARSVVGEAPVARLESGHSFADAVVTYADGTGRAVLPSDFLRLVSFRMSDWRRAVSEPLPGSSAAYPLLSSRRRGVRGCPDHPRVAVVPRAEGLVLEFSGSDSGHATVSEATYQPVPRIDAEGWIDLPPLLHDAVVWRAAAMALAVLGDARAEAVMTLGKGLLS